MTPKTLKSSLISINRAQMERVFATSLPLDSRLQLSVRQRSSSAQPLAQEAAPLSQVRCLARIGSHDHVSYRSPK